MKLAALGTDPDLLALIAAAKAEGHEIVWLGDVRPVDMPQLRGLVNTRILEKDDWEVLLDGKSVDAVLVGQGMVNEEQRSERLKRLVAAGVPLVIVHPAALSVLTYYELDMVSREVGGVLRHYNPVVGHPSLNELAESVGERDAAIGLVLQIACTREIANASREVVLAGLARDAELLTILAGDIRRVSAIGPKGDGASFASLQVQLESAGPATLRWSVAPRGQGPERVVVLLIGEQGTVEWAQSNVDSEGVSVTEYSLRSADGSARQLPFDAAALAIRSLAVAIDGHTPTAWNANANRHSTWPAATRAMEIVDAVELSLQKGRSVEVHQQKLTEQLAFRGTMAAFGCGLMLLVAAATILVGVVGGAESLLQAKLFRGWAAALLAILGAFLVLQIVPHLGKKRHPPDEDASGP